MGDWKKEKIFLTVFDDHSCQNRQNNQRSREQVEQMGETDKNRMYRKSKQKKNRHFCLNFRVMFKKYKFRFFVWISGIFAWVF
jgi:hypothetical protein